MNEQEVKQNFQQAAAYFQAQQYEQALQLLERLDGAVPNNPDIMYFKARVLGVLNRNYEAAALCDRLTGLGDPRGGQLKAAIAVAPAGPPPMPDTSFAATSGPPPIMPDQDTAANYAQPPQVGNAPKSNKKMNIIGFGLMGVLLLSALIVVLVRSGGGDSKESAPPKPTPPPQQMTSAAPDTNAAASAPAEASPEKAEQPAAETDAAPKPPASEEKAGADEKAEESAEKDTAEAVTAEDKPPAAEASGELSATDLASMSPADQVKAISEMDDAQLAELLKNQTELAVNMMEQQATTPEQKQMVAVARQQLETTDFVELAKMTRQMLSQMDPQMLAQMGNAPFQGGSGSVNLPTIEQPGGTTMTDDIMKSFNLDEEKGEDTAEQPAEAASESEAPGTEASEASETPSEETEASQEISAEPSQPEESPEPQPEEEEDVVKPVFGKELAMVIEFPKGKNLGTIFLRRKGAPEREPWEQVADARGKIGIPPNQDVKLQMQTYVLEPLLNLQPDSIQVLSLWSVKVRDEDIGPIKHLTGLEELDIRQTRISPDGWEALQKALPKCRILY